MTILSAFPLFSERPAHAGPDLYIGDTAIYSGSVSSMRPNVLIIFDNSKDMNEAASGGPAYNPSLTYPGAFTANALYKRISDATPWVATNITMDNLYAQDSSGCTCYESVRDYGSWTGQLQSSGACGASGANYWALGNFLNYNSSTGSCTDCRSQASIIRDTVANLVGSAKSAVNFGLMVFGSNQSGGKIIKPIADISSQSDYNNFVAALPGTGSTGYGASYVEGTGTPLNNGNGTPLAESLYDAGAYFNGISPLPISKAVGGPSPTAYSCQKNFVIVLTNGSSTNDCSMAVKGPSPAPSTYTGSMGAILEDNFSGNYTNSGTCTGGQANDYMDNVARFLYNNDHSPLAGTQNILTYTVGVFASNNELLGAAAVQGHGRYYNPGDANTLSAALTDIISSIVLEADSVFVAPVVPVSPENRTYSGGRVYLGFFKPISQRPWQGNLKKYGINGSSRIVDRNGAVATNEDGSFKETAISYWSSVADGGAVNSGGAGEILKSRDLSSSPRKIYTYLGTSAEKNLTLPVNAFSTSNTAITAETLGASSAIEKDKLLNYIYGLDAYDEDGDGNTTGKREWIIGDILHSRPLVVNYSTYSFNNINESDCNVNKGIIYVGGNDGMLHAFRDCDGSEAWAFIPQDLLSRLRYLTGLSHAYFVDSSPVLYKYDVNGDGNIDAASGDKVVIIFGERRGGGADAGPAKGYYYALDVSNPVTPVYMWRLGRDSSPSGADADYSEMGETWSEPKIVKMRIGGLDIMVAVIGGGYDNINEDGRYGATQTYSGAGTIVLSDTGSGVATSSGTGGGLSPKGRGIYLVEVAQLNSTGVPSFSNSGRKIWGYSYADNTALSFSMPGEVSALDTDNNGYIDRLYIGDTGGNIWRFNVGGSETSGWTGRKVFSSNQGSGGSTDVGRKIFYKPSVSLEPGYAALFFGTGDREHPLNSAIMDRNYGILDKDTDQTKTVFEDNADGTHKLVDVTDDALQAIATTQAQLAGKTALSLSLDTYFGWYVKLNEVSGEKVLSPALLFNKVAYYTTYAPSAALVTDPCDPGSLGVGAVYALNYKTGEAVVNYDKTNDIPISNSGGSNGVMLMRSDRKMTLGTGIPSGIVVMITAGGQSSLLIGCGGAICSGRTTGGGSIIPLYWRLR